MVAVSSMPSRVGTTKAPVYTLCRNRPLIIGFSALKSDAIQCIPQHPKESHPDLAFHAQLIEKRGQYTTPAHNIPDTDSDCARCRAEVEPGCFRSHSATCKLQMLKIMQRSPPSPREPVRWVKRSFTQPPAYTTCCNELWHEKTCDAHPRLLLPNECLLERSVEYLLYVAGPRKLPWPDIDPSFMPTLTKEDEHRAATYAKEAFRRGIVSRESAASVAREVEDMLYLEDCNIKSDPVFRVLRILVLTCFRAYWNTQSDLYEIIMRHDAVTSALPTEDRVMYELEVCQRALQIAAFAGELFKHQVLTMEDLKECVGILVVHLLCLSRSTALYTLLRAAGSKLYAPGLRAYLWKLHDKLQKTTTYSGLQWDIAVRFTINNILTDMNKYLDHSSDSDENF